jgi:hypothetical protein
MRSSSPRPGSTTEAGRAGTTYIDETPAVRAVRIAADGTVMGPIGIEVAPVIGHVDLLGRTGLALTRADTHVLVTWSTPIAFDPTSGRPPAKSISTTPYCPRPRRPAGAGARGVAVLPRSGAARRGCRRGTRERLAPDADRLSGSGPSAPPRKTGRAELARRAGSARRAQAAAPARARRAADERERHRLSVEWRAGGLEARSRIERWSGLAVAAAGAVTLGLGTSTESTRGRRRTTSASTRVPGPTRSSPATRRAARPSRR